MSLWRPYLILRHLPICFVRMAIRNSKVSRCDNSRGRLAGAAVMWAETTDHLAIRAVSHAWNLRSLEDQRQPRGRAPLEPMAHLRLHDQEGATPALPCNPLISPAVLRQNHGLAMNDKVGFSLFRMPVRDFAGRSWCRGTG